MKRALPSYEDLLNENDSAEEGEIIESEGDSRFTIDSVSSDEEEFGLKAVLPVGKFNEHFKEGQVPESGEQYLCTVRSQRNKLEKIVAVREYENKPVELKDLLRADEPVVMEFDLLWAEKYWTCYKESEVAFIEAIDNEENEDMDSLLEYNTAEWYSKLYTEPEIEPNMRVLKWIKDTQDICDKLLNLHKKWLKDTVDVDPETLNKMATWLQALLMCRDSHLTSPEIANFRQLAAVLIANHGEKVEMREIVLVIVKKYGQSDLIKYTK